MTPSSNVNDNLYSLNSRLDDIHSDKIYTKKHKGLHNLSNLLPSFTELFSLQNQPHGSSQLHRTMEALQSLLQCPAQYNTVQGWGHITWEAVCALNKPPLHGAICPTARNWVPRFKRQKWGWLNPL